MNILADYKSMIRKEYVNQMNLSNLNASEIRGDIDRLYRDLNELDVRYGSEINNALILMTKLYCYQLAINMKVIGSVVPDSKDPDNKYAQARGAVKGLNKKRIWISHYLGPVANYLGKHGHLIPIKIKRDGQVPIIKKTIEKLLSQVNEL